MRLPAGWILLAALVTAIAPVNQTLAAPHLWPGSSRALDEQMAATLMSLSAGDLAQARVLARQMARSFPRSALAQLLSAELEITAAHKDVMAAGTEPMSQPLMALLMEARARLHDAIDSTDSQSLTFLPAEIIQLGKDISAVLVVDLADSTLHHLAVNEGLPTLLRKHYVGSGKAGFGKRVEGDNKTPLGIYGINGYRSDASLPDLYGSGALTLDYPNALDRYLGRTGSGIWLHGVPHSQRSRAPRSSEGCVTMSNDHFMTLQNRLWNEQPHDQPTNRSVAARAHGKRPLVLLTHSSRWVDAAAKDTDRIRFRRLFDRYQMAWQQRDAAAMSALYEAPELPLAQLADLQRLDSGNRLASVPLRIIDAADISIFINPALITGDARFDRTYLVMKAPLVGPNDYLLTLYWAEDDKGQWQIVTEYWEALNV